MSKPRVFNIPADVSFIDCLAAAILAGGFPDRSVGAPTGVDLARWRILTPTRRAARVLSERLVAMSGRGASVLPRIEPIGDIDEDDIEIAFAGVDDGALAPAIGARRRQFLLAQLIMEWAREGKSLPEPARCYADAGPALALARSLAGFIDGVEVSEVGLGALHKAGELDLAWDRQTTMAFLAFIEDAYPRALTRLGVMGAQDRRNRLIDRFADALKKTPPRTPVIAAGSTGSIPATARLLKVVAHLPLGAVVLPGLDRELDEESWRALTPLDAQYGLGQLLERIEVDREAVRDLVVGARAQRGRAWLIGEVMRPQATSDRWREVFSGTGSERLRSATRGMHVVVADTQAEEARIVALMMRATLAEPGRTAAVVCADRSLARAIKAELTRWRIEVDDSAGEPLSRLPAGQLSIMLARAGVNGFGAGDIAALLAHGDVRLGLDETVLARGSAAIVKTVLRTAPAVSGLDDLRRRVAKLSDSIKRDGMDAAAAAAVADRLSERFRRIEKAFAERARQPFAHLLDVYMDGVGAAVGAETDDRQDIVPAGEDGAAWQAFCHGMREHAQHCPAVTGREFATFIAAELALVQVRARHVRHRRLAIYGLLEARLVRHDVMILAGLNEGVWPVDPVVDPWLNRPQREEVGLESPERRIGMMAHDFAGAAAAPEVWLTRARKNADKPAVASRWLHRLETILLAAGEKGLVDGGDAYRHWARALHAPPGPVKAVARPVAKPPRPARQHDIPVSGADMLFDDPYGIYVRHILQLRQLDPIGMRFAARERGNAIHAGIDRFCRVFSAGLPGDAVVKLAAMLEEEFARLVDDAAHLAFWRPWLRGLAEKFIALERQWRQGVRASHGEVKGALAVDQTRRLTARADRIDVMADGTLRIIDYKTGAVPALTPGAQGYSRQLDLEVAMAAAGGFSGVAAGKVSAAAYVKVAGNEVQPKFISADDLTARAHGVVDEVARRLAWFDDEANGYEAQANLAQRPRDHDHLSRWREWYYGARRGRP